MKLVADEGVDRQIVERLRLDGHEVTYVAEVAPGQTDEWVLSLSNQQAATLLTQDKDFGELVVRRGLGAHGVVLLRLAGLGPADKCELASNVFRDHLEEIEGAFCVLSVRSLQFRKLSDS